MAVFVLDKNKKPLMPCSEKRAKSFLDKNRAVVHKSFPFTIRMKDRKQDDCKFQDLRIKIDPGSRKSGMAVLRDNKDVIFLGEIKHRTDIKDRLDSRRSLRRARRNRKTRYRKPRFLNRKRKKGWLPPSLEARVNQNLNFVNKINKIAPLKQVSTEHVKFDTHLMTTPGISGEQYQQGTLQGYEVREYLLEKFNRTCGYCNGKSKDNILNIEHVVPRNPKSGDKGTDRISNLALACSTCNVAKGNMQPKEWLASLKKSKKALDKERVKNFTKVMAKLKKPLKDAAMMNATRWRLVNKLKETNLEVEIGTGARTKMQRLQKKLPKQHYYDAICVGASTPDKIKIKSAYVVEAKAIGRGNRQIMQPDKYGFPRQYRARQKSFFGFQTGDIVKTKGYTGRLNVRKSGSFYITIDGKRISTSPKKCILIQRGDGWRYSKTKINQPAHMGAIVCVT